MRTIGDIMIDPRPGDCIEYQGKVFEIVYTEEAMVVYRAFPARPKRAKAMSRHGWKTLCRSGARVSEYSSQSVVENPKC